MSKKWRKNGKGILDRNRAGIEDLMKNMQEREKGSTVADRNTQRESTDDTDDMGIEM